MASSDAEEAILNECLVQYQLLSGSKKDPPGAIKALYTASAIYNKRRDYSRQAEMIYLMAEEFLNFGTQGYDSAVEHYKQAFQLAEQTSNTHVVLGAAYGIGTILLERHDLQGSVEYFDRAVGPARRAGNNEFLGDVLLKRGSAHHNLGNHQRALEDYLEALGAARQCKDRETIAMAAFGAGRIYGLRYQDEKACEAFTLAQKAAKVIGNESLERQIRLGMIRVCH